MVKKRKGKQSDLPGMPEKGELAILAERFLMKREELDTKKDELHQAKEELLLEMHARKVFELKLEEIVIERREGNETLAIRNVS